MANARGLMCVSKLEDMGVSELVTMKCLYDENNPEDKAFSKWTPSGTLTLDISNPALLRSFHLGDRYYLDLTKAPVRQVEEEEVTYSRRVVS